MTFDCKLRSVNILKIIPPLITLLNSEQEIQYVALRNIRLIIQRFPDILKEQVQVCIELFDLFIMTTGIQVFFCKYLDPCYVKEEKLDIIVSLVCEQNIEKILNELKEYATEIDIEFVRHSIRAIGQCAISIETTASLCVEKLIELLNTRVNYIVQEVVIVMRDIFRKYPNRYEGIIKTVCDCLENLDDPTAKSAMIWIIGEYAERIDNSEELLSIFFDTFTEESSIVQLQLLTSVVKIFLKCPSPISHSNMERLLSVASFETDDPDIRDRAFVYWRLLSSKSESAHEIILCKKPVIQCQSKLYGDFFQFFFSVSFSSFPLDKKILDELLHQLSMINSIQCK